MGILRMNLNRLVAGCLVLLLAGGCDWRNRRETLLREARTAFRQGQRTAALKAFAEVLKVDPYSAEANMGYAICLAALHDRAAETLAALERCRLLEIPDSPDGQRWRDAAITTFAAISTGALEEPADAVRDFLSGLGRQDPQHVFARSHPRLFLQAMGESPSAESVIREFRTRLQGMRQYEVQSRIITDRTAAILLQLEMEDGQRQAVRARLTIADGGYWVLTDFTPHTPAGQGTG